MGATSICFSLTVPSVDAIKEYEPSLIFHLNRRMFLYMNEMNSLDIVMYVKFLLDPRVARILDDTMHQRQALTLSHVWKNVINELTMKHIKSMQPHSFSHLCYIMVNLRKDYDFAIDFWAAASKRFV